MTQCSSRCVGNTWRGWKSNSWLAGFFPCLNVYPRRPDTGWKRCGFRHRSSSAITIQLRAVRQEASWHFSYDAWRMWCEISIQRRIRRVIFLGCVVLMKQHVKLQAQNFQRCKVEEFKGVQCPRLTDFLVPLAVLERTKWEVCDAKLFFK